MDCANLPLVMITMAENRSLADVLCAVTKGIAECKNVALARLWLVAAGDRCDVCEWRARCPNQTRCLHLAADASNPRAGGPADGGVATFNRYPLGVPHLGNVALTATLVHELDLTNADWIVHPEWVRAERIRTFAAQPLQFRGENLGALEIWDRTPLGPEDLRWLRVFADHAAVSIANARAFEEIEFLKARLKEENNYLREEVSTALGVGHIIGSSPGLKKVMQQIQLVAPTDAAVLVTGESGTGKELVARAIHENSPRQERALIKVNCGAVPETLFESEFFGHMKGSFTGAMKDKPGRFELADGGTLFLDEIGEVPLPMQAKLLRVLQEQEIERLGDTRTRKINVRIIAATNRDLKQEVEAGRFRQDLFYRLSVFPIEIPPLRERPDDIAPLALHFVKQAARRMNRPAPRVTHATLAGLAAHNWPGNVRELQNAVERAVILSQGGPLRFEVVATQTESRPRAALAPVSTLLTRDELKRQERASIAAALQQSDGKIFGEGGAAELLGMKPTTLASRIKALKISKRRAA